MGEKRTVYSVSEGDYSDYKVEALFEDRADAEATAKRTGWYVEEFVLYGPGSADEVLPRRQVQATAWVDQEGRISDGVETDTLAVDRDEEPGLPQVYSERHIPTLQPDGTFRYDYSGKRGYQVSVWADDVATARKAARDHAARVAAAVVKGQKPLGLVY